MLQQLSGLDASFLYLETANSPMHVGGLAIYDPSSAPGGQVGFKQIMANVAARAHQVPAMNNVLVEVPMRLDHPYWKSNGPFDPEFHIRHIALPKPGDWRQLCIQAARLHARPLDRSRPLWEFYIIEGLDNVDGYPPGCFALLSKMHHAAIDGASGVEVMGTIHDLSSDYSVPHGEPVSKEETPTYGKLLWQTQINNIKTPARILEVAKNTVPGFAKSIAGLARGRLTRVTDIPRTRFNTNVSPHRVFEAVEMPLDEVKAIKNAAGSGVTINDVAITICGGGLRKYLESKNELPERSLAAMAPINVRTVDQKGTAGNQVSQMTVRVGSDIADPLARLLSVNEGTGKAKQLSTAVGAKAMTDYSQFIPSTLAASAVKVYSRLGLSNRVKPFYNCVITNVPGPQVPLYFTGARLSSNFALGPPIDGMGLFHGIMSYCGTLNIGVSACREMMPDPAFYAQCLHDSYQELYDATVGALETERASSKNKVVRKKARKKQSKKKTKKKPAKPVAKKTSKKKTKKK